MLRRTTIRLAIAAAMIALAGVKVTASQSAASAPTAATTTTKSAKTSTPAAKPGVVKTKASPAKTKATKAKSKKRVARKDNKPAAVETKPASKPAGPWRPNNPIAQELSSKPKEVARARRVLPAGTDLNAATAGFRNYSQFAAAINATESKNLDFGKLKALMTGVNVDGSRTHRPTMTLSEATQTLHGTATTPPGGPF